jgi:hypothetical protein
MVLVIYFSFLFRLVLGAVHYVANLFLKRFCIGNFTGFTIMIEKPMIKYWKKKLASLYTCDTSLPLMT